MSIQNLLSTAFTDSVIAINRKLTIDDAQRNVNATYLGANKYNLQMAISAQPTTKAQKKY